MNRMGGRNGFRRMGLAALIVLGLLAGLGLTGGPAWAEHTREHALAEIEAARAETIADMNGIVADFESEAAQADSQADLDQAYNQALRAIEEKRANGTADIRDAMAPYPLDLGVQAAGAEALTAVEATAKTSSTEITATYTTTTVGGAVTTTTLPKLVTTTTKPPAATTSTTTTTTTTTHRSPTTTTKPASPVTTGAPPTTRVEDVAPSTDSGGAGRGSASPPDGPSDPAVSGDGDPADETAAPPEALPFGGGVGHGLSDLPSAAPLVAQRQIERERGPSAAVYRFLARVLPAAMVGVVVTPLMIIEQIIRALLAAGRGVFAPASALALYTLSMLFDRRRKASTAGRAPGTASTPAS